MTHADQDQPASGRAAEPPSDVALLIVALAELRPAYPVTELLGRRVYNDEAEEIGRVEDLMIDQDRVAFAILAVGGFLGIGTHQVVAPFAALRIDEEEIVLPGATREVLKSMTVYDPARARSERETVRKPRRGVRDAGEIVTTAADEPIAGVVADVTDGDLH